MHAWLEKDTGVKCTREVKVFLFRSPPIAITRLHARDLIRAEPKLQQFKGDAPICKYSVHSVSIE